MDPEATIWRHQHPIYFQYPASSALVRARGENDEISNWESAA